MNKQDILALFKRFGAEITSDDVWMVQQAIVVKHKALERLAVAAGIQFERPTVIRAERDECVIMVHGTLSDRSEWSIGEALVNVNYRASGKMAAYVYAMAEKRAKDRVILKLAGLHGIYSEDEADEFKEQRHKEPPAEPPAVQRILAMIDRASDAIELGKWMGSAKILDAMAPMAADELERIAEAQKQKLASFEKEAA